MSLPFVLLSLLLLLPGCASSEPENDSADSDDAAVDDDDTVDNCGGGEVEIAFYDDADCTNEVARLTFDITQSCHGWTRNTPEGGARDNSATQFQCWQDRICYTQHVENLTCDSSSPTDKVARTDLCLQEPTGMPLWSQVASGTELCPPTPAGFECPLSDLGEGTTGTFSACEGR